MPGSHPNDLRRQELERQIAPLLKRLREAGDAPQKEAVKRQMSAGSRVSLTRICSDGPRNSRKSRPVLNACAALCEQRRQAKNEILRLQLDLLQNEAVGLGFFGGSPQAQMGPPGMMSGMMMGSMGPGMRGMEGGNGMEMGMSQMGMGDMRGGGYGAGMGAGYGAAGGLMAPGGMMGGEGYGEMGMMGGMGGGEGIGYSMSSLPAAFLKRIKLSFQDTPLEDVCEVLARVEPWEHPFGHKISERSGGRSADSGHDRGGGHLDCGSVGTDRGQSGQWPGGPYEDGLAIIARMNTPLRTDDASEASQRPQRC